MLVHGDLGIPYVFSDQATTADTHSPLLIPIPLKSPLQKQVAVHERSQAKRRWLEVCFFVLIRTYIV